MSHPTHASAPPSPDGAEFTFWRDHTQISLQPVAAPSVLGLFGFAAATFMVATNYAGWYGTASSQVFLFPLAAVLGGLAQFLAGMWAYRARDGLATAVHGTWGSFWLAYGILYLLVAVGVFTPPTPFVPLGYWFIVVGAITWSCAVAALAVNIGMAAVLFALAVGSSLEAVAMVSGLGGWGTVGAWALIVSALIAWYTATAMLMEGTFKRVIMPVGRVGGENKPGEPPRQLIQYPAGDPGIKVGQ